jgi:hypothetical protein
MFKKTGVIRIVGISAFFIFFFPAITGADQHYDQYPGGGFVPWLESTAYFRSVHDGFIHHNDTGGAVYMCPVNFNVPDGSVYFIKSIGMRFYDNLTNGNVKVRLQRINLFTGAVHLVANWDSNLGAASTSVQTASKATNTGFKLVDSKKFAYWLYVDFYTDVTANPCSDLKLYQVRVHYGT